jgi:hypothetical protein
MMASMAIATRSELLGADRDFTATAAAIFTTANLPAYRGAPVTTPITKYGARPPIPQTVRDRHF